VNTPVNGNRSRLNQLDGEQAEKCVCVCNKNKYVNKFKFINVKQLWQRQMTIDGSNKKTMNNNQQNSNEKRN